MNSRRNTSPKGKIDYQALQWECIQGIREAQKSENEGGDARVDREKHTARLTELTIGLINTLIMNVLAGRSFSIPHEDLVQEGLTKMLECMETYDPAKGSFNTYMGVVVQRQIRCLLREEGMIRIPASFFAIFSQARKKYEEQHGRKPEDEDLVKAGLIDKDDLVLLRRARSIRSESQSTKKGGEADRQNHLIIPAQEPEESDADPRDVQSAVRHILNIGAEHKRIGLVLRLRFGIAEDGKLTEKPLTLSAIGMRLDLSKERVRQIQNRGMHISPVPTTSRGWQQGLLLSNFRIELVPLPALAA